MQKGESIELYDKETFAQKVAEREDAEELYALAEKISRMGVKNARHISFLIEWVKNGKNGTKAYMATYPNCKSENTAATHSSLILGSINLSDLLNLANAGIAHIVELTRKMEEQKDYRDSASFLMKLNGVDNTGLKLDGKMEQKIEVIIDKENAPDYSENVDRN